ncbi:hypothetical protein ACIGD1_12865 [Streptomyces sp. NPDC085612]|uniref:hypothetical protein n=1 Tax=Streptomyces sp. NPDC085612 TaxID=3365732 RepID=UPI0037D6DF49
MLVLTDGGADAGADAGEAVLGCLRLTYVPGVGPGTELMRPAVERARGRGCGPVQPTSNKQRGAVHRFYERLGFARSHEGFKLHF